MPRPFESAERKIARAGKHFDDLVQELNAFEGEHPYERVVEPDPGNPQQLLHKVKLTRRLVETAVPEIVGDVISNLRAALDHAVYGIAVAAGRTDIENAYFPFCRSAERLDAQIKGRCANVPEEVWPLLRSFQPYKGGNDLLFALNAVRNADNHAILTPIGTAMVRPYTKVKATGFMKMTVPEHSIWDSTKNEVIFLTTGADTKAEYEIDFEFFIAFEKVGIVDGQPVLRALHAFAGEVERVLSALQEEARRLGFIP